MGREIAGTAQGLVSRWSTVDRTVSGTTVGLMEALDGWGYITTGFSFLVIGIVVLG